MCVAAPVSRALRITSRASLSTLASGLCVITCLPARRPAIAIAACRWSGVMHVDRVQVLLAREQLAEVRVGAAARAGAEAP